MINYPCESCYYEYMCAKLSYKECKSYKQEVKPKSTEVKRDTK